MSVLFPEPGQPRTRRLGRVEPGVHWFTESTRPEAADARTIVNAWYSEFDDPDGDLARALRSEKDANHYQALDELHLHHLLRQKHADVRYEETGSGPDFRIYSDGGCVAAIEVLSLFQRQDWTDEQFQHGRLADQLDLRLRPTAGYFVNFELKTSERDPSPRRFARFVETRIEELPPYDQAPESIIDQRFEYRENGVHIEVRFMPMRPGAGSLTDPDAGISGMGPVIGGFVNSAQRLRRSLEDKARSLRDVYDVDGLPFLVAVGVHDIMCEGEEVLAALFGTEAVVVETGALTRQRDGFFGVDRQHPNGRRRNFSGIVVLPRLPFIGNPPRDMFLYHNPWAAHPWPHDLITAITRSWGVLDRANGMLKLGWIN